MDDGVQQQALRIYQEMPLLAGDLFSGIVPRRITRSDWPCMLRSGFGWATTICAGVRYVTLS
jgi:hypothetical protein